MALITWTDEFSVGVKSLDEQHQGLIATLNGLHAAMLAGNAKDVTGELLKRLVRYTQQHFFAEESLMKGTGYPQIAEHCAQHQDLTAQVAWFAERYERGEAALTVDLLQFLREWLLTHIQKTDREYGPWMNAHGVK